MPAEAAAVTEAAPYAAPPAAPPQVRAPAPAAAEAATYAAPPAAPPTHPGKKGGGKAGAARGSLRYIREPSPDGVRRAKRLTAHSLGSVKTLRMVMRGAATPHMIWRMKRCGLVTHTAGSGTPAITAAGSGLILAHDLGLRFFEVCVLAKAYHAACQLWRISPAAGSGRSAADGRTASNRHNAGAGVYYPIPWETLRLFFREWSVGDSSFRTALSNLRRLGLLPRAPRKTVLCDVGRLAGMHEQLLDLGKWVDEIGDDAHGALVSE